MPDSLFNQVRQIDNSRAWMPIATFFIIVFSIVLFVWFFRGGSFQLYASIFFGLYYLTGQIWLSVILLGFLQSVAFLPLRFISLKMSTSLKSFEDELDRLKNSDEQYILFQEKVKKGDFAIIFYIFYFLISAIAFFSAGRLFLIDFYNLPLDPKLIYDFIPYPQYPLVGSDFHFPFFQVNQTFAISWKYIIYFWLGFSLFFAVLHFVWRLLRFFLSKNESILKFRIGYNKILFSLGGAGLTIILVSTFILRHLPSDVSFIWLVADLTRQNSTMNLITAIGTFLTVMIAGLKDNSIAAKNLKSSGVDPEVVAQIIRGRSRQSFQNALILGIGAYVVTSQIPSAFELSVATFEVIYILSPFTFDRLLSHADNHFATNPDVSSDTK